jgi:hypothetical protein
MRALPCLATRRSTLGFLLRGLPEAVSEEPIVRVARDLPRVSARRLNLRVGDYTSTCSIIALIDKRPRSTSLRRWSKAGCDDV